MRHPVDHSALLDTMAEGLYVVDRDRVTSYWSAAAERIAGFSAAEVVGRSCGDGLLNHLDESDAITGAIETFADDAKGQYREPIARRGTARRHRSPHGSRKQARSGALPRGAIA